jgi:hypothetical protein
MIMACGPPERSFTSDNAQFFARSRAAQIDGHADLAIMPTLMRERRRPTLHARLITLVERIADYADLVINPMPAQIALWHRSFGLARSE